MAEHNFFATVVKALATTNPVGSAIVSAVNDFLPSAHDKAVQKFAESLRDRIDELGDRLNSEYVRTEQFADLFKNCMFISQRTQHDEKLRAAANILLNALLVDGDEDKLPYDELDHFTRCVENLSIGAIHVLAKTIRYAEKHSRNRPVKHENTDVTFRVLLSQMPEDTDRDLLMGLVGELSGYNLLHSRGEPGVTLGSDKYGNYPFETTPLGYRFVVHVLEAGCSTR